MAFPARIPLMKPILGTRVQSLPEGWGSLRGLCCSSVVNVSALDVILKRTVGRGSSSLLGSFQEFRS